MWVAPIAGATTAATVTVGATGPISSLGNTGADQEIVSTGYPITAAGVLTTLQTYSAPLDSGACDPNAQYDLQVLRPNSSGGYTVLADTGPQTDPCSGSVVNYPVNVVVQPGDVLGAYTVSGSWDGIFGTTGLAGYAFSAGLAVDPSVGSTVTTTYTSADLGIGDLALDVAATEVVDYAFSGFAAPIGTGINVGKAGRTYPVKFSLTDATGSYVSDLGAVTSITSTPVSCGTFSGDATQAVTATTTGDSGLRYDTSTNQYVYNWATAGAGCYLLTVSLMTGQSFPAKFQLS